MDLQICKSSLFVLQLCGKKREAFFDEKKAQKSHFPKSVNPCFWSKKMLSFSLFDFGQNKTSNSFT